jgi:hypothetical protein
LFATKRLCPVGVWLKDAGRGLQSGLRRFGSFTPGKPLVQDDVLKRGEFAPRGFVGDRDIGDPVIGKQKPYREV